MWRGVYRSYGSVGPSYQCVYESNGNSSSGPKRRGQLVVNGREVAMGPRGAVMMAAHA